MRLHAIVRGDVQMVGFRYFVLQQAQELGLTGWVRNGEDGQTVEIVAEATERSIAIVDSSNHWDTASCISWLRLLPMSGVK